MTHDYRCPHCGSREVRADALAAWNVTAQAWELASEYDNMTCLECEREGHQGDFIHFADVTSEAAQ